MSPFIDRTGGRFERLLVLKRASEIGRAVTWLCLCDCGNTTIVPQGALTSRNTKSCGCLKEEQHIHDLGWNAPEVRNPRRRELYAQKVAMGYKRERTAAYKQRKRERHRERRKEEPEALRGLWNKASKRYRERHPEIVTANNQKFRTKNPDYGSHWYALNRASRKVYNALYNLAHPEVQRANSKRRRAYKLQATQNDFTDTQWAEMQAAYGYRCVYCPSICKLCKKGTHKLTQDHITPLSKGGIHTASNIVPSCRSCNSKKSNREVLKPVQPVLLLVNPPKSFSPRTL